MNQQDIKNKFKEFYQSNGPMTLMEFYTKLGNFNVTPNCLVEILSDIPEISNNQDGMYIYQYQEEISKGNDFSNQFFHTIQKSNEEMKDSFGKMMGMNMQILQQQGQILQLLQGQMSPPVNSGQVKEINFSSTNSKPITLETDFASFKFTEDIPVQTINNTNQDASTNQGASTYSFSSVQAQASTENIVKVKSFAGNGFYDVNLEKKTCSCPNYIHTQSKSNPPGLCKHLKAAMKYEGDIQDALST